MPIYECSNSTCGRSFTMSQVSSAVPGSTSGEIICPHCKSVHSTIEPDFGRSGQRLVVTDPLPVEQENALRREKGLAALPQ
jgi:hypothetical protein